MTGHFVHRHSAHTFEMFMEAKHFQVGDTVSPGYGTLG